jgi:hypothetical protein|tara:strand:+ start:242 stop:544 length:303 start_codon:yes stop_codon:yes gene_type:complete
MSSYGKKHPLHPDNIGNPKFKDIYAKGMWDDKKKGKKATGKKGPNTPYSGRFKEEAPTTNTSSIPNIPGLSITNVTDKRRKATKPPLMLKRFREYMKEKN